MTSVLKRRTSGESATWARPPGKRIYFLNEASLEEKDIIGVKGANLCEMSRAGLPVPPAFTCTTQNCIDFAHEQKLNPEFIAEIKNAVRKLEGQTFKRFGGVKGIERPLLFSVRSSASHAMPGMMSTVLNLGMNDQIYQALCTLTDNSKWAMKTYIRFMQMFGTVVLHIDSKKYSDIIDKACARANATNESLLDTESLATVVEEFQGVVPIPDDPWDQLFLTIEACFTAWYSPMCSRYRDVHGLPEEQGTAVTVQSMAYGNMNMLSGTGILYTRNPVTGINDMELYGLYLANAEGEEVTDGERVPMSLGDLHLEQPEVYKQLSKLTAELEKHYKDMQEVEFTVENMTINVLETRTGKRTARAAVCIAVSMVQEELITEREALLRINPRQMEYFQHRMLHPEYADPDDPIVYPLVVAKCKPGAVGVVSGKIALTNAQALDFHAKGEPCILVKKDINEKDIDALKASVGCVTNAPGYAAQKMYNLGKAAVVGAWDSKLDINDEKETILYRGNPTQVWRGAQITIDGASGIIYKGQVPTVTAETDKNFITCMKWADHYKRIRVLANASTQADVLQAHHLGAEGIGSLHTEQFFRTADCASLFQKFILENDALARKALLSKMLPLLQGELIKVYEVMGRREVTVRLLDASLQSFLPNPASPDFESELTSLAISLDMDKAACQAGVMEWQEENPAIGLRGCRIASVYPELAEMQAKAVVGAAIEMLSKRVELTPRVMIPGAFTDHEVNKITAIVQAACDSACAAAWTQSGYNSPYLQVVICSEAAVPRACLRADRMAGCHYNDSISFNTDRLTELIFGMSKDDSDRFMPLYLQDHLVARDPFVSLDMAGVGGMIRAAVTRVRDAHKFVKKLGASGDHCGDPLSVQFFDSLHMDFVSCSPHHVPVAKLSAAQSHIVDTKRKQSTSPRLF